MKKTLFSTATAIILIMLFVVSSASVLKPTAKAESDTSESQLRITGLVEHQLNLSLTELEAMPQTTVYAAILCVDSPDRVVEEGNWVGVRLSLLLEAAGVSPTAVKVAFYASDGYSTDLTVETAEREDVILAYEKDGVPLSEQLRLVVPGKWGYKWISQITVVDLVDYDFLGYWESYGYSDTADINEGSNPPPVTYPDPGGTVPEFPSVTVLAMPLVLVGIFALILNKRTKTQKTL
jgi:DMSO/TMAO reductase YedYZ molybdopterin-dependent catalytic subunit